MRYEADNCAIVVSIKELSNDVLKVIFNLGPIFVKYRSWAKAIYSPWIFMFLESTAKWTSLECSSHADHNGANPSFISPS